MALILQSVGGAIAYWPGVLRVPTKVDTSHLVNTQIFLSLARDKADVEPLRFRWDSLPICDHSCLHDTYR